MKGCIYHVVNDFARRIERAGLLARGCPRFGVIGGEQVLKDAAEQLGVEGDFLLNRCVLGDGELIAVEDVDDAADGVTSVFRAVNGVEIGGVFVGEEEFVRNAQGVIVPV